MTNWVYEVQVLGTLSETALARIDAEVGNVLVTSEPISTVIRGIVADQSALVGMLDLMHALGLEVCGLRRVTDLDSDANIGGSAEPGSGVRAR